MQNKWVAIVGQQRLIVKIVIVLAALLFAYAVWPSPYHYTHAGSEQLIRIHRLTGSADILRGDGWERMAPRPSASQSRLRSGVDDDPDDWFTVSRPRPASPRYSDIPPGATLLDTPRYSDLPPGFVLDKPSGKRLPIPPGYVLDETSPDK